jgi:protein involved in polysaccharide export with SLBB domain
MQSNSDLDDRSTILQPYDQLIVRRKPEWIDTPKYVTVEGEVIHPGRYRVDKRETLCGLMTRIGGFTEDAYLFGTAFFRESVRQREQRALDRLMEQMDDLLAEVHMSPGFNKAEKLPSNQGTNDTFQVIKQLKPAKALGRLVIDMESAVVECSETADLVLEDGDRIVVPKYLDEVSVAGQVYFPTSHKFQSDRAALDYINLSGGTKELAQREHAYVVQANGEVMTVRSRASTWGWLGSPSNVNVTPGSTIVVPLSVDRINGREFTQSWLDMFYKLTVSMASIDFLFTQ